ncbi:F-box/kelch-repeat protein At3g06240-like [Camellia sinensis]|uniref:F-box/kelch-repeat protein At3g06240-like n=1 Tax=Camellia sinensis TaxID=4442 RepID=UPI001035A368|nr:F-box/kelch-repeat protein At3g06240-like [Camellia sinensis]
MKATRSDFPILPQELIAEILCRLPVKSLSRFKSVSHSWCSLISNPHFAQTHFTQTTNKMPDRLILISDSHILFSVDYSVDSPVATEIHFPSVEDESYDVWAEILGSCNGLVLALNESDVAMYLLNPSTRESKKIPESPFALNSVNACNLCGLGYDSMSDDFKIVMLSYYGGGVDEESGATTETNTIVSVYSLKSYSWRKIQGSSYLHCAGDPSGVYLNGCIHWLAQRSSDYISVIVAFDLGNEVFREFLPPPFVNNAVLPWFYPAVLGGYLCLPAFTDVWVMKEYGKKESWTKFSICKREDIPRIDVVCLLEDGEFLLSRDEEQLVVYNSKDETSRDMVVCGIPGSFTSGGTYVESLISPERIHGIGRQCEACERMKRILQVMVETYEAGTCQSSTNKESSSSSNIEAPTSSSGGDRASLSICLHFLKFIQMVEGPFYEKALRMFQDPLWRKLFINMACEKKMF